jgi:hypothetical protein
MTDDWAYTTEPAKGPLFIGPITDEMVESVMRDLLTAQLAVIQTLKPSVQEDYMRAMRNHVRSALTRALRPASRDSQAPNGDPS